MLQEANREAKGKRSKPLPFGSGKPLIQLSYYVNTYSINWVKNASALKTYHVSKNSFQLL